MMLDGDIIQEGEALENGHEMFSKSSTGVKRQGDTIDLITSPEYLISNIGTLRAFAGRNLLRR
jgi:hypothetical protein